MLLRYSVALLCLLAAISLICAETYYDFDCETDGDLDIIPDPVTNRSLCEEFRVLRNVIPHSTFVSITIRHYRQDTRFRNALRFIQSAEFVQLSEYLEETSVYQQMLVQLQNAGVNTADVASISTIFDCLIPPLPVLPEESSLARSALVRSIAPESRSLQSYATSLMRAIPRDRFVHVLAQEVANNTQFALFYRTVRTSGFQRNVLRGLTSREVSYIVQKLKLHFIDLRQLASSIFRVLSWGPRPF